MRSSKLKLQTTALAMVALLNSCGRTDPKVNTSNDGGGANKTSNGSTTSPDNQLATLTDPNCKDAQHCDTPQVTLSDGTGSAAPVFAGMVNQPVSWTLAVKTSAPPGRAVIAIISPPSWLSSNPGNAVGTRLLTGTPIDPVPQGTLQVVVRDYIKCHVTEKTIDVCNDVTKKLPYDQSAAVGYTIAASGSAVGGVPANVVGGGIPANQLNGQQNRCVNSPATGIMGILGKFIPGPIGGLVNMFTKKPGC